jgi:hypothetical protein
MKNHGIRLTLALVLVLACTFALAGTASAAKPDPAPSSSVSVFINSWNVNSIYYSVEWDRVNAAGYNTSISWDGVEIANFDTLLADSTRTYYFGQSAYQWWVDGGLGTYVITVTLLDKKGAAPNHARYNFAEVTIQ